MQQSLPPLLLAVALVSGCESARESPAPAAAEPQAILLPASALAGVVRALETVDAVRPEGALAQVRALAGDTRRSAAGPGTVRVFLDLTVYAATSAAARQAFDELRLALEAEGRATTRVEPASAERVARVMAGLDWDPPGREDLVSFSDRIRLELAPGRNAAEPLERGSSGPPAYDTLERYVRRLAAEENIGDVDLAVSPSSVARGVNDHRFRIREQSESARFTLAEIGGFLSALELGSPAARLTELKIERSQHEPDVHAARGWTFDAVLCVRTGDSGGPLAAAPEDARR